MIAIGELSRVTGCAIDTIRYYEKLGLLGKPPLRTEGGHRVYNQAQRQRVAFIVKARHLGFSLERTRELLSLSENADRSCAEARQLVDTNLAEVRQKIADLAQLQTHLEKLSRDCQICCPSAKAPDCTILEALQGGGNVSPATGFA